MITTNNFAKVGDDSGDSTTKDHEIYESFIDGFPRKEKFKIVDSMMYFTKQMFHMFCIRVCYVFCCTTHIAVVLLHFLFYVSISYIA